MIHFTSIAETRPGEQNFQNATVDIFFNFEKHTQTLSFSPMETTLIYEGSKLIHPSSFTYVPSYFQHTLNYREEKIDTQETVTFDKSTIFRLYFDVPWKPSSQYVLSVKGILKNNVSMDLPKVVFVKGEKTRPRE